MYRDFPIDKIREQFPALKRVHNEKTVVYFDGPGGSQVVEAAIDAMAGYMRRGGANLHGLFPSSHETEKIIEEAKEALGDLLGVDKREIAFGANATSLTFAVSRALGRNIKPGDEIVVSEIDHRAGVDPWITMAEDKGAVVRWIKVDLKTLTLDLSNLNSIINEKTVLVAAALASNAIGTINDIERISKRAREVGAIMAVDAVHAVPHIAIDCEKLGADILVCSTYKFFGPHIGIIFISEKIFETLVPYKLMPAPKNIPDKLETGTQNHEGIAGIRPAVDFIASIGEGSTRREKLLDSFKKIEVYENRLANKIRDSLALIPRVKLYQASADTKKTPTIAFRIEGISPQEACKYVIENYSVFIADGDYYATTLAQKLQIDEKGGFIRAGLAPYNTEAEVDIFINAIKSLVSEL
jgi:cysteine desulfurase family protein (TIGR01976 family)